MRKFRLALLALAAVLVTSVLAPPAAGATCEIFCWTSGNQTCWQAANCTRHCCITGSRFCTSPCG